MLRPLQKPVGYIMPSQGQGQEVLQGLGVGNEEGAGLPEGPTKHVSVK